MKRNLFIAALGMVLLNIGVTLDGQPLKAMLVSTIGVILFLDAMFRIDKQKNIGGK